MAIKNTFGINIIPDNDLQRVEVLAGYKILDTPSEDTFDNIAKLATQIFQVPIALISLVDKERVFFKANIGMGKAKVVDRGASLCSLAVLEPGVTVFEDALKEPCLIANPNVAGDFGLRFYAGAPITTKDGFMIGTLCIIDKKPREFSEQNKQVLAGLANLVIERIDQRLSDITERQKLSVSEEELASLNEELTAMNEELSVTNEELMAINEQLSDSQQQLTKNNEQLTLIAKQLSYVNDTIPQQVWTATPDGSLDFVNEQTVQYFGKSSDDLTGENWIKVVHPDDLEAAGKAWGNSLSTGEPYQTEFRLLSKDDKYVWHLARAVPFIQDGKIIKWFGTNTDIDGHKQLVQHKNDFISIASHELKTPITSLKASLQLLDRIKDNPSPVMLTKLIDQSNRGMQKISCLVDDLLSVSRINEGQLHLNKTKFNLGDLLHSGCSHVQIEGGHDITFKGDIRLELYADEHLIEQVVINLVNNAVKYAPDSKSILITFKQQEGYIKISVKDNGPGISKEKQAHLFDRYYRVDHSGQQYSGLGLGLYICAEIIKKHGGQIGVESELGNGSTFWFSLPTE